MPKNREFFIIPIPNTKDDAKTISREFNAAVQSVTAGAEVHLVGVATAPGTGRVLCIFRELEDRGAK